MAQSEGILAPGRVSDGTMPCPVPDPDTGSPCVKPIPKGWTADQGHGGGHFWVAPSITKHLNAGAHCDAGRVLAGLPTRMHLPVDCAPECPQWTEGQR